MYSSRSMNCQLPTFDLTVIGSAGGTSNIKPGFPTLPLSLLIACCDWISAGSLNRRAETYIESGVERAITLVKREGIRSIPPVSKLAIHANAWSRLMVDSYVTLLAQDRSTIGVSTTSGLIVASFS